MKAWVVSIRLNIKAFVSTRKQQNPGQLRLPWLTKLSLGEMKHESCWAEYRDHNLRLRKEYQHIHDCTLLLQSSVLIKIFNFKVTARRFSLPYRNWCDTWCVGLANKCNNWSCIYRAAGTHQPRTRSQCICSGAFANPMQQQQQQLPSAEQLKVSGIL